MGKFVGKFRQDRNYSDDYNSTKNFTKGKKPKSKGSESHKLRVRQYQEEESEYGDYVDKHIFVKM